MDSEIVLQTGTTKIQGSTLPKTLLRRKSIYASNANLEFSFPTSTTAKQNIFQKKSRSSATTTKE
jgi:hypothetical protein